MTLYFVSHHFQSQLWWLPLLWTPKMWGSLFQNTDNNYHKKWQGVSKLLTANVVWKHNTVGDSIAWNYVCCSDHPKHLKQPTSPWMCSVSKSWASELQPTHRDRVYSLFLEKKKKWKKNIEWTLRTFRGKSHEERKHFLNCPWTIRIVQSSLNKCCWMQTLNTTLFDGVWKQCVIFI